MESRVRLDEAFERRPDRLRLLEKGLKLVSWETGSNILEIGCSLGDASSFLAFDKGYRITAIDISKEWIERAQKKHSVSESEKERLRFLHADAAELPFPDAYFHGIYSEAAFAPMKEKADALKEYCRVLQPGGRILLNDFMLRSSREADLKRTMSHIPCFAGVCTAAQYDEMFRDAGFQRICFKEEYGELIRIAMWLSKVYGGDSRASGGGTVLKEADLSYCQIVYEKRWRNDKCMIMMS